jgi:hypothetical protein
VLDEQTLAIPDRPGNQRVDTFRNLFESPASWADLLHVPAVAHDSWVVGDEEYVSLHFLELNRYAVSVGAGA